MTRQVHIPCQFNVPDAAGVRGGYFPGWSRLRPSPIRSRPFAKSGRCVAAPLKASFMFEYPPVALHPHFDYAVGVSNQ